MSENIHGEPSNIAMVCKECLEELYPDHGKIDPNIGDIVKVRFRNNLGNEYMWVKVTNVDKVKGEYEGILENDPIIIEAIKLGDVVKFIKDDVFGVDDLLVKEQ